MRIVRDRHGGGAVLGRTSELRHEGVTDDVAIAELRAFAEDDPDALAEAITMADEQGLDRVHYDLFRQYRWLLLAAGRPEPRLDATTERAFAEQKRLESLPEDEEQAFCELARLVPGLAELEREVRSGGPQPRPGGLMRWLRRRVNNADAGDRMDRLLVAREISQRISDVLDAAPRQPGSPLLGSFGHSIAFTHLTRLRGVPPRQPF